MVVLSCIIRQDETYITVVFSIHFVPFSLHSVCRRHHSPTYILRTCTTYLATGETCVSHRLRHKKNKAAKKTSRVVTNCF